MRVSGPAGRTGQVCARAPAAPSGRRRHRPAGGRGRRREAEAAEHVSRVRKGEVWPEAWGMRDKRDGGPS